MVKQSTTWIISFIIGIISSLVAGWFLQNIWLTALLMLATILGVITVLLYRQSQENGKLIAKNIESINKLIIENTLEISKSIEKIHNTFCSHSPQCCGLISAGFCKVAEDKNKTLGTNLENISKSYKFLGVSAEFLLQTENFSKIVKQKIITDLTLFYAKKIINILLIIYL